MRSPPTSIKYKRAERMLEVRWPDEGVVSYGARELRIYCRCASCIHEFTGAQLLKAEAVPQDIEIAHVELAGNYALKLTFSDGHRTGIYTWDHLHEIRPTT